MPDPEFQLSNQASQRLAAMAEQILLRRGQLRHRHRPIGELENRVVAETAGCRDDRG